MDAKEHGNEKIQVSPRGVSYRSLCLFGAGVFFGAVTLAIVRNALNFTGSVALSPLELINFTFSIALAAASTILSITAIIWSRISEEILSRQSAKGTELQNEIHARTLEVLSSLQSSTGINEKRIEDIAREIKDVTRAGPRARKEIDEVLRTGFQPSTVNEELARKRHQAREEKQKYQDTVLHGVANIDKVQIKKIEEGLMDGEGEALVDGIFSLNEKQFSVSVFFNDSDAHLASYVDAESVKGYILKLANEISKGVFDKSFVVFNDKAPEAEDVISWLDSNRSILNDEIAKRLFIVHGNQEHIVSSIADKLK
jgi:hypothetical protein